MARRPKNSVESKCGIVSFSLIVSCLVAACFSPAKYHLPGHAEALHGVPVDAGIRAPDVTLPWGEEVKAITPERGKESWTALWVDDPSYAEVRFWNWDMKPRPTYLRGVRPGTVKAYYVDTGYLRWQVAKEKDLPAIMRGNWFYLTIPEPPTR